MERITKLIFVVCLIIVYVEFPKCLFLKKQTF